ncbi:hypothetical protein N7533_011479 [Penicillium manginii]|uniref:uncharacterized protein n=1 Tax=Penicillium manginii TaxID=203109 RepID=UPI00254772A8|nr:uncharacterized protein N7533_011479 [Penicillium manginii]KAJ5742070.1 hypothetical protein N7533_011479 [Penicillium manginii]
MIHDEQEDLMAGGSSLANGNSGRFRRPRGKCATRDKEHIGHWGLCATLPKCGKSLEREPAETAGAD